MNAPALIALLALLLSFAGFTALSLAMDRHQEDLLGRVLSSAPNHGLRTAGAALLLLALAACLLPQSPSVAAAVWLGLLSLAALGVAALLSYFPRALLPAAGIALLVSTVLALMVF